MELMDHSFLPKLHMNNSFTTYATFSEKLKFFTPDTHTSVCVSGGKKW